MFSLFKRELKSNLKALIIWTVSCCALVLVSFWEYGATADVASLEQLFLGFPDIVNVLFGVSSLGMKDILGYFALIMYYVYFVGISYAFVMGNNIMQKEVDDKTSEFLFTKPISRTKILIAKILVPMLNFAIFNAFSAFASVKIMTNIGDTVYSNSDITTATILSFVGLFLLMILVFMVTLSLNVILENKKKASALSGVFILYTYAMNVCVQIFEPMSNMEILTPWKYFYVDTIVNDGYTLNFLYVAIVIVICFILYILSNKKIQTKSF